MKGICHLVYNELERYQTHGTKKENGERNVPEDHFLVFTLGQEI